MSKLWEQDKATGAWITRCGGCVHYIDLTHDYAECGIGAGMPFFGKFVYRKCVGVEALDPAVADLDELPDLIRRLNDWRQWEKTGYNHDLLKSAVEALQGAEARAAKLEKKMDAIKSLALGNNVL